jgi:hypothetical protein
MNETPPPTFLVQSWLDVIQDKDIPEPIKLKRMKLLKYYFGSIEHADMYLEQNHN